VGPEPPGCSGGGVGIGEEGKARRFSGRDQRLRTALQPNAT